MNERIGFVGGYGAVGRAAVRTVRRSHAGPLRVGGRSRSRAAALVAEELAGRGEAVAVDVFDPDSLARFCAGCAVVVNASGPSYVVIDRVARAALAAGADYVDAGGDQPLHHRLSGATPPGRRALVTTGMMPGLSGLLPRWLAGQGYDAVHRLVAYVGVMDLLTPAGSLDYLLSLGERAGESQALWLDGRPVTRAATPLSDVELPFFPGRVSAYPYLGYEPRRLAGQLGLSEVRWYSVFDGGGNMMASLSRLQGAMSGDSDLQQAAGALRVAAGLDLFGREPYQLMVFELAGTDPAGAPLVRTLVVRSDNTSEVTGTVCGLGVLAILAGDVAPGVHYAAEGLEPAGLVAALRDSGALRAFELHEGPAGAVATIEEGVL